MTKSRFVLLVGLLTVLSLLAAACGPAKPAALPNDKIIELTKNILTAIDKKDYAAFSEKFSDEMKKALPESQFIELADKIHAHSGKFVSVGEPVLSNKQGFAVYQIPCQYEQEEIVVTIVFRINGDKVEGLFFNSPFLRATPTPTFTPTLTPTVTETPTP